MPADLNGGGPVLASKKERQHERTMLAPPANPPSVLSWRKPGQSFLLLINVDIDYVALLVTSFVSFIVLVFVKVPLPGVVPVMRFVILAFTHPLLVPLVFRIVLVLT
jgi:hypothetical protein